MIHVLSHFTSGEIFTQFNLKPSKALSKVDRLFIDLKANERKKTPFFLTKICTLSNQSYDRVVPPLSFSG